VILKKNRTEYPINEKYKVPGASKSQSGNPTLLNMRLNSQVFVFDVIVYLRFLNTEYVFYFAAHNPLLKK
jgi:hypothetical protein